MQVAGRVSRGVALACIILFLALRLSDFLRIASWGSCIEVLGVSRYGLLERAWWFQVVTSPLIHFGVVHLAFNMLALWTMGPDLESTLGRRSYVTLTLVSSACATIAFLLVSRPGAVGGGYSGVIFGILVAQAWFFPERLISIFGFFTMRMRHAALILALIELYLALGMEGSPLSHAAHIGGAAGAWGFLKLRTRVRLRRDPDPYRECILHRTRRTLDIPDDL